VKRRSTIALGFLALIAVGAIVLSSPWARAAGTWGDFGTALFTACSAVCVTGLTVVDIAQEFSRNGQIVLLALVEVGCLGLMTCSTFLLVAIGRRLSLSREFTLMNAYGVAEVQGLRDLILWVVGSMAVVEVAGTVLFYVRFHDWYLAVFYSVMSFCNAGFGVLPGSMAGFADDPYVIFVAASETILGGIGFLVIYNLCTFKFLRRKSGGKGRLSLHSAVVLRYTVYLLAIAFAAFLAIEWDKSLAGFDVGKKLWVAFYQAVTPRTCGFCVIPTESLQPLTRHIYEALMFIGGGPGSAAAGIKLTTLAVLIATLRAMCRGEQETVISRRAIPYDVVRESLVIVVAMLSFIWLTAGALSVTEANTGAEASALFFEAVSAVTTTGLSVGSTTPGLSQAGRVVIMVAMFTGRLGALTVVMMIGDRESNRHVKFPTEEIVVG
jgi:trk system potassium uptake protein TrkH